MAAASSESKTGPPTALFRTPSDCPVAMRKPAFPTTHNRLCDRGPHCPSLPRSFHSSLHTGSPWGECSSTGLGPARCFSSFKSLLKFHFIRGAFFHQPGANSTLSFHSVTLFPLVSLFSSYFMTQHNYSLFIYYPSICSLHLEMSSTKEGTLFLFIAIVPGTTTVPGTL